MAASAATKGFGTTVEYLATDPSTYASIGELVAVTPPNKTRETIDVTHMASPDGYREHMSSLRDGGTATLTFNYTEAGFIILNTIFHSDDVETFRITYPDGATEVFTGLITEAPINDIAIDDKIGMAATIKVTGKPAFTAAP